MSGTKLKNLKLTSVDLVPRGANPDADISFFKSAADGPQLKVEEQSVLKKMFDMLTALFKPDDTDPLAKADSKTFSEIDNTREYRELVWRYNSALNESIDSILNDEDLDDTARLEELNKSLGQYTEKMKELFTAMTGGDKSVAVENTLTKGEILDMANYNPELLSAEERATFETLCKKCAVEEGTPAPAAEPTPQPATDPTPAPAVDPVPAAEPTAKSATDPAVAQALAEVNELKKSLEMGQLKEIAKKYVPLGKKEDELANTLYDLKKSGQANYDAYIAALDESLALVEKSGVFGEVGKSTHGPVSKADGVVAQIDAIAKGYRDADPTLDYNTSMMRAWENNPNLLAEYEKGAF